MKIERRILLAKKKRKGTLPPPPPKKKKLHATSAQKNRYKLNKIATDGVKIGLSILVNDC